MTIAEWLKAAAEDLRRPPDFVIHPLADCSDVHNALADLIDQMLDLDERAASPDYDLRTLTPDQAYVLGGHNAMYEAMPMLARYVRCVVSTPGYPESAAEVS